MEGLAAKRETAHSIAEAQKKASVQAAEEIAAYMEAIAAMPHARFQPGAMDELRPRVKEFNAAYAASHFPECSQTGPKLAAELGKFQKETTVLIAAFNDAAAAAQSQLAAVREELEGLDLAAIERWSQKAQAVAQAAEQVRKDGEEIERLAESGNRAEQFTAPQASIAAAIAALRDLAAEATDNHARFDARDDIRKAVVDALSELRYDIPDVYYEQEFADGSGNELSDLTIYAHNPAETGDMLLTVNLDGEVKLGVFKYDENGNEQEVTQQDAENCHQTVTDFGYHMAAAGFALNVTNWGKAADLPLAKSEERVLWGTDDPTKKSGATTMVGKTQSGAVREQQREMAQTHERERQK